MTDLPIGTKILALKESCLPKPTGKRASDTNSVKNIQEILVGNSMTKDIRNVQLALLGCGISADKVRVSEGENGYELESIEPEIVDMLKMVTPGFTYVTETSMNPRPTMDGREEYT